jgi:hypothetical protein
MLSELKTEGSGKRRGDQSEIGVLTAISLFIYYGYLQAKCRLDNPGKLYAASGERAPAGPLAFNG